jgi:hypothetical protein
MGQVINNYKSLIILMVWKKILPPSSGRHLVQADDNVLQWPVPSKDPPQLAHCLPPHAQFTNLNFNISGFHIVVLFNLSEEKVHIPSNTTK